MKEYHCPDNYKQNEDSFKPFPNKKADLTKHNKNHREHSITTPANTIKSHPFEHSNNWSQNKRHDVLQKSPKINLNPLKINPNLSQLCLKTQAADVIALCQANYLKINIKRRPIPAPSNRRNHQPSNNKLDEVTTKIVTTKDEVMKKNSNTHSKIQTIQV